jgi:hypothetical protein
VVKKKDPRAGSRWLTPIILATQEAEIRRIAVHASSDKYSGKKNTHHQNGLVEWLKV